MGCGSSAGSMATNAFDPLGLSGLGGGGPSAQHMINQQIKASEKIANYGNALSHVDQYTPFGNSIWQYQYRDSATGAPIYKQTFTVAPELQGALQSQFSNISALGKAGEALQPQLMDALSNPLPDFQTSYDNAYQGIYDRGALQLDPQWQNRQSDLTAQLANSGVLQNSDAWNRAMSEFSNQRGVDYAALRDQALSGAASEQQRAIGNAIALRQEPINEMSALMQGGTVTMPQFTNTPAQTGVPAVNAMGAQQGALNYSTAQQNSQKAGMTTAASIISNW